MAHVEHLAYHVSLLPSLPLVCGLMRNRKLYFFNKENAESTKISFGPYKKCPTNIYKLEEVK
jgi:hypothetical protein